MVGSQRGPTPSSEEKKMKKRREEKGLDIKEIIHPNGLFQSLQWLLDSIRTL